MNLRDCVPGLTMGKGLFFIKLSSKSYLDAKETLPPHCNLDELFSHSEDIIVTSGGLDSLLNSLIKKNNTKEVQEFISKMTKIFSDRFYFEIQRHNDPGEKYLENNLLSLSKKFKVPLIASQEVFYINKDMFEAHDALLCIGQKTYVDEKNRKKFSLPPPPPKSATKKKKKLYKIKQQKCPAPGGRKFHSFFGILNQC